MPAIPASRPLIWRSPSMKRATVTTLPPWGVEVLLGAVQPLRRQKHVSPESLRQRAAAEVADHEADVVADDGGEHRDHEDDRNVHLAGACEDRRGDQHDLAGYRDTEILQEQHPADSQVPVVLQQGLHVPENTGQLVVGHACNRNSRGWARPDFVPAHLPGRMSDGGEYSFAAVSSSRRPSSDDRCCGPLRLVVAVEETSGVDKRPEASTCRYPSSSGSSP
jgi:hypothetical protein